MAGQALVAAFGLLALSATDPALGYAETGEVVPKPAKPDAAAPGLDTLKRGGKGDAKPSPSSIPEDALREAPDDGGHGRFDETIAPPSPDDAPTLDDIRYGETALPPAVAETRALLMQAARSGHIAALRPVLARQRAAPIVSTYATGDAIRQLTLQSGDDEGREILAILLELLETGYVVTTGPSGRETYVWPYFAEVPLARLRPEHQVQLYRVLTAIDVEELERLGRYTFFRVGISETGALVYFTAGDVE